MQNSKTRLLLNSDVLYTPESLVKLITVISHSMSTNYSSGTFHLPSHPLPLFVGSFEPSLVGIVGICPEALGRLPWHLHYFIRKRYS